MTLICFASQKGSPGATATALAVAASLNVQDGRRKLLLEADSTGGTLAIRYQLPVEPGLLTLAAAVRAGMSPQDLWLHTRELPGGLPVIVCPDGPEQVNAAMSASGAQLGRFLAELRDVDVICDVGRLAPDSPAMAFVAEASAVLMVARPTAEQLQPAARRMIMLKKQVTNLGWVLIGQKPYGPAEVESTYDFPVVGVIADDPRSVASFESGVVTKRLRRHPFVRSATTLANTLSNWLSPITEVPAAAQATAPPDPAMSKPEAKATSDSASSQPSPPPSPSPQESPAAQNQPGTAPTRKANANPATGRAPATRRPPEPPPATRPLPETPITALPAAPGIEMDLGPQISLEPAPGPRQRAAADNQADFATGPELHAVFTQPEALRQQRSSPKDTSATEPSDAPEAEPSAPPDDEGHDPNRMAG